MRAIVDAFPNKAKMREAIGHAHS